MLQAKQRLRPPLTATPAALRLQAVRQVNGSLVDLPAHVEPGSAPVLKPANYGMPSHADYVCRALAKAGFGTLWDLLQHLPRDYNDMEPEFPWTGLPLSDVCISGHVRRSQCHSRRGTSLQLDLTDVRSPSGKLLAAGEVAVCKICLPE